jgi:hypothetical protein
MSDETKVQTEENVPAAWQPNQTTPVIPLVHEESDSGIMARWSDAAIAVVTNIQQQTPKGRAIATRCLASADLKTRNVVGQQIRATHFFAHTVEITNTDTGEITKKVRVVLVLEDGRTVSTTSKACVRCLSVIAQATKGKAWDPPIILEVREFPTEDGRSYCDMREVPDEDVKQTKKK